MDCYQEVNNPNSLTSIEVYWLNIHIKQCFDLVTKLMLVLSNFVTFINCLLKAQNIFLSHQDSNAHGEQ